MRSMFPVPVLVGVIAGLFVPSLAAAQEATRRPARPNPVLDPVEDVAGLPRVLLIGDSISMGYTLPVRELLKGKANVHRVPTNGGPTTRGLEQIDAWLGSGKWDVIHFNWGLHDLKYIDDKGALVAAGQGKPQVPIDQYEQNLDKLVTRLKQTGASLIWCSTTPVPEGSDGRVPGDDVKYNAAALRVMQKHGVAIDDLYEFAKPRLAEIQRPANVHFSDEGSKVLAEQVVRSISAALAEKGR
jgi:hypothetical protein